MKKIIILNKEEGETPLEALQRFRESHKKYQEKKITYAGRLDPMASGLLLLLVDEEIKNKEKYQNLDKEYSFQILFGFATDTYDILGKIINSKNVFSAEKISKVVNKNLKYFLGERIQRYPKYSSKTVQGKPLFFYARAGLDVNLPTRKIVIQKLEFNGLRSVNPKRLLQNIEKRIKKVRGDFRQKEIIEKWRETLQGKKESMYLGDFSVNCGSGTYVRGIANSLGRKINIPCLAFSIKRIKIGKFVI